MNLMEGAQDELDMHNDPKDREIDEVEEIEAEKDGRLLWSSKGSTPIVEKKWLRKNIFRSTSTVDGHSCIVVIDGKSCERIISQTLVDCLKLKVYRRNHPFIPTLSNG